MRLKKIELNNIGPYIGNNIFDFRDNEKSNISLICGNNGAGKTSLLNAIKIGLYGYRENGYSIANVNYKNKIKLLLNEKAKLNDSSEYYIKLNIEVTSGTDLNNYSIKRAWTLKNSELNEKIVVTKNENELSQEEVVDFEKYLASIVSPELFNLYFFDGDSIIDYFFSEESNFKIKEAIAIISGYDTFDIIYNNFKKLAKTSKIDERIVKEYLLKKDELEKNKVQLEELIVDYNGKEKELLFVKHKIETLRKAYARTGGIKKEEYDAIIKNIKIEEQKRVLLNLQLKKSANDILPFVMLKKELETIKYDLKVERENKNSIIFMEMFNEILPEILKDDHKLYEKLNKEVTNKVASKIIKHDFKYSLSEEAYLNVNYQINQKLKYTKESIINLQKQLKKSLLESQTLNKAIKEKSIDGEQALNRNIQELKEKEANYEKEIRTLNAEIEKMKLVIESEEENYKKIQKQLDENIKSNSISDLSIHSIRFIEKLQKKLYKIQLVKIENLFIEKLNQLIRKDQFISKIKIGDKFNFHIFKKVRYSLKDLISIVNDLKEEEFISRYGTENLLNIYKQLNLETYQAVKELKDTKNQTIELEIEISKSTLSNGEKQIFIMTFYWSLIQLTDNKIPFIIDTPFARIDTRNRENITKEFFMDLKGQVFILSTNEEITKKHMDIMSDKLLNVFTLENKNNEYTEILCDSYFGEVMQWQQD